MIVLTGLCAAAAASGDAPAKRRAARDAPFVPAVDPLPVPGFAIRMRGERLAYCRVEQRIGTRLKTEICIDQAKMPEYLAALEENRQAARQLRAGENVIDLVSPAP